jgi:predicted ribosomally synthesized peptide with nif11-like leader
MSREAVVEFLKHVDLESALRAEVQGVPSADVVQVAARRGFMFTRDEYEAVVESLKTGDAEFELGDEDLKKVSGGMGRNIKRVPH